jgi:hypothetical protein
MLESAFRRYVAFESATIRTMIEDVERCYPVVVSHDGRFDGWFYAAVASIRVLFSLRTSGFEAWPQGSGTRATLAHLRRTAPVGKPRKNTGRTS